MRTITAFFLIAASASGAIARVGSCSTFDDASTDNYYSFNLSPAMNVVAGNTVIIIARGTVNPTSVTVGGVAATLAISLPRNNYSAIYYLPVASANSSATITVNSGYNAYVAGIACQYSGIAASGPLDATATDNATWPYPQNTATSNPFTTTTANELIIAAGGNGSPYTAGSGYSIYAATANSLAFQDQLVSTIQTGAIATLVGNNYSNPNLLVATFKAAPVVTGSSQQFIF